MKSETMNSVLTFVLGVFIVLGVIAALRTINRTRELRSLQMQATQANGYRMGVEALANDAVAYSKQNPNSEILHILQPTQAKPANR